MAIVKILTTNTKTHLESMPVYEMGRLGPVGYIPLREVIDMDREWRCGYCGSLVIEGENHCPYCGGEY